MPFTQQQLVDAYNQMVQERQEDANFAKRAADKLAALLNLPDSVQCVDYSLPWGMALGVTPYTSNHSLVIELSQYDDWQGMVNALQAAGVQMKPWGGTYQPGPEGTFDVSADPAFAGRNKLTYTVKVNYFDSHAGGY